MHPKLAEFHSTLLAIKDAPFALAPSHHDIVAQSIASLFRNETPTAFAAVPRNGSDDVTFVGKNGKTAAILTARGIALPNFEWQPLAFSTKKLARDVTMLSKTPDVHAIIIAFDTPGGAVSGTPEAAAAVREATTRVPVYGVVEDLCASAGYYIASQCAEISAMESGAGIGSIGVRTLFVDYSRMLDKAGISYESITSSKFKDAGAPFKPLSAEYRALVQAEIDALHSDFVNAVAEGRNVSFSTVNERFGQGRVLRAIDAKQRGMIDRMELPDAAISRISSSLNRAPKLRVSAGVAELERLRRELDEA